MANRHRYKKDIIEITQDGHRTADNIYQKIKKKHFFIGIGSIYRNLTELVNEGLLMKSHGLGDKVIYEKTKAPHAHLFCHISGMIQDIDISMIDLSTIQIPKEFCLQEVNLTIAGYFNNDDSNYCKINGKITS